MEHHYQWSIYTFNIEQDRMRSHRADYFRAYLPYRPNFMSVLGRQFPCIWTVLQTLSLLYRHSSFIGFMMSSNTSVYLFAAVGLAGIWIYKRVSSLRNLPGPPSSSLLAGSLLDLVAPATGRDWQIHVNNTYGGVAKFKTLFGGSSLLVNDPKALHHILVKDQEIFEEWPAFAATNGLLFGPGLVATIGSQHKKQRKMLTPAFSIKHLRGMAPMFVVIARELETNISALVKDCPKEIDVTQWLNRFALEAIGRGGMGHSFGKMSESTEYSEAMRELAATVSVMVPGAPLTPLFKYMGPRWLRRFALKLVPWTLLQRLVDIVNVMDDKATEIFAEQQKDLEHAVADKDGKDIMGILLRANRSSVEADKMSNEEMVGQISTLVFTATDTTSGAMARVLHLLAQYPEVQEKLRAEVTEAFHHQDEAIDFNNVSALPYLDAVIKETLRVHPPIPTIFRRTLKDIVIPLYHPITGTDGRIMNEVHIEKGTDIFINIIGANHNPKTWGEDASEWKPERWLSELPESVTKIRDLSGVYAHQMTFIAGNRACIGFNFAQMEMRIVLAILLQSLEFSLPKDKEIGWNLGLLMTPVVKGSDSIHSHLPLIIKKRDV
ncbi:hypothetical protein D9619_011868 [Psilocybe cf. subviscida]|uniref:Cytochrome P450 n=1 Tax=Psilocybe cf. subviscida TaxID=2480587 RepID=A0A8H5B1H3_9AGAR|nr:hypothetical protein D9619_011868 [Psilocybe cf. subviscida]